MDFRPRGQFRLLRKKWSPDDQFCDVQVKNENRRPHLFGKWTFLMNFWRAGGVGTWYNHEKILIDTQETFFDFRIGPQKNWSSVHIGREMPAR